MDVGIDRQRLERIPGILLCPTHNVEPTSPLPDRAADLEVNAAFSRWGSQLNSSAQCGMLLYHRPSGVRLSNFGASAPFRIADDMHLTSEPAPSDAAARQPYLRTIVQGNPALILDGGDLLPPAEEALLGGLRRVLRQLPTAAQVSELAKQSVVVRTYASPEQTLIVVMNSAPWRVEAQVTIDGTEPVTLEPVIDSAKSESLPAGRQVWNVSLAPYDLRAYRFSAKTSRPTEVSAKLSEEGAKELKRHVEDLAGGDLSAPHVYRGLANPSFEPTGSAGAVPGWRVVGGQTNVAAGLDAQLPQDGKTSLHVRNANQVATIESDPFPIPATGQLAMTVFARSQNTPSDAELRLIFEYESEGRPYRLAANVKTNDPDHNSQQWRPFAIFDADLPLDSRDQMRIKFEFAGPGDFWLDNIKLNDTLLPLKFYPNSSAEIVKLLQHTHDVQAAYDAGQLQDCLQLLDGYWPHFVTAYTPPAAPAIALAARPSSSNVQEPSPPPSGKEDQYSPGLGERLKRIVPILK